MCAVSCSVLPYTLQPGTQYECPFKCDVPSEAGDITSLDALVTIFQGASGDKQVPGSAASPPVVGPVSINGNVFLVDNQLFAPKPLVASTITSPLSFSQLEKGVCGCTSKQVNNQAVISDKVYGGEALAEITASVTVPPCPGGGGSPKVTVGAWDTIGCSCDLDW